MDFQVGIFCLVFISVLSLIIYAIISFSSIKEDSFEEAKANRRKIIKQFQDQTKTGTDKSKDKKNKKQTKKSKKPDPDTKEGEPKEASTVVEEVKSSEVILPVATKPTPPPAPVPVVKQAKAVPVKAAPTNKDAKPTTKKRVKEEEVKTIKAPKKEEKVAEPKKVNAAPKVVENPPKKEVVVEKVPTPPPQVVETVPKIPTVNKSSRKKRSELTNLQQLSSEKEAVNINLLSSLVQKAELSRSEIQLLIDALLNKQQDDVSEWSTGRQDPIVKLQKQLNDVEETLKAEKENSLGLQAKLKELRLELNTDRATFRIAEESLQSIQEDCKSLTVKLERAEEENRNLSVKLQQCQQQLSDEKLVVIKLKQEKVLSEEQCQQTVVAVRSQVNQLAAQSQELQSHNNSLRAEVVRLKEFRKSNEELERALSTSQFETTRIRNEMTTLERAAAELGKEVDSLNSTLSSVRSENQTLQEKGEQYILDYKKLVGEVQAERERNETLSKKLSENWENGYSHSHKKDLADYEAKLEEHDHIVASLNKEMEIKNQKIEELNHNLHAFKCESQKNQALLDKANAEILSLTSSKPDPSPAAEAEITIKKLNSLLADRNKELSLLKKELETSKTRNNELQNKNWKIVEALTKAEQSLQSKIVNEQNSYDIKNCSSDTKIRNWIKRLIVHLHPEIEIDDSKMNLDDWLVMVEDKLSSLHPNNGLEGQSTTDMQMHISHLQSLVVHYKTIITETEGMLNQLQKNLEVEESRWKEKLMRLEEELGMVRQSQTQN